MLTTLIPFRKNKLSILIFKSKKRSKRFVLFFFGGSKKRAKERFLDWQKNLFENGINSVTFDYSGTGDSTGNFKNSSLDQRINEGIQVVRFLHTRYGKNIEIDFCAGSMGAYIAIGALNKMPTKVKKLILFCPAAYSNKVHNNQFDIRFTNEIRRNFSWRSSRSFKWIKKYQGQLLILVPEHDEIIPKEIPTTYLNNAKDTSFRRLIFISNATHNLLSKSKNNRIVREKLYSYSLKFLKL